MSSQHRVMLFSLLAVFTLARADTFSFIPLTETHMKAFAEGRLEGFTEDFEWHGDPSVQPFLEVAQNYKEFDTMVFTEMQRLLEMKDFSWEVLSEDTERRTTVAEWVIKGLIKSTQKPTVLKGRNMFSYTSAARPKCYRIDFWPMDAMPDHQKAVESAGQRVVESFLAGFISGDIGAIKEVLLDDAVFEWTGKSPIAGSWDLEGFMEHTTALLDFSISRYEFKHDSEDLALVRFFFDSCKYKPNGMELITNPDSGITAVAKISGGKMARYEITFDREPSQFRFILPPPEDRREL